MCLAINELCPINLCEEFAFLVIFKTDQVHCLILRPHGELMTTSNDTYTEISEGHKL